MWFQWNFRALLTSQFREKSNRNYPRKWKKETDSEDSQAVLVLTESSEIMNSYVMLLGHGAEHRCDGGRPLRAVRGNSWLPAETETRRSDQQFAPVDDEILGHSLQVGASGDNSTRRGANIVGRCNAHHFSVADMLIRLNIFKKNRINCGFSWS